jgi:uncharacterized damage-inducible protein DinB
MTVSAEKRQEILNDIHQEWGALIDVLQGLSTDELEQPNVIGIWSLKDLIGHLETWDRIAIKKIRYTEQGKEGPWWKIEGAQFGSIDEFNEADADRNRHRSIDDLWNEMLATHQELVERVQETPVLSRDLIREDTYGHYRDHLNDIRQWRARQ